MLHVAETLIFLSSSTSSTSSSEADGQFIEAVKKEPSAQDRNTKEN